ncbi:MULTISPECIES: hypothetical protein [Streptomyces]|jgi:hypothetical protein|uniref:Uncharacterized protein n=2 Tax=Streptomyces TaxID=1883 RepID=A0A514JPC2_9ACTN|nr:MULTISPECIES: hypothetical protein [Streptomyces]MBA8946842.1 hypothetical protein [Streptomyces calvus]MBA8974596.1 hypothetical protein [Streptomyces calvus]MYS27035.1 hypothetical protein [Streptomyces sp. SID7804]QDI69189.1 hypothetical protein CD934_11125 [Streptomyces calvus]GGP72343.1 hypothetical protein GCM10010247_51960 [Streptomyces calvus]
MTSELLERALIEEATKKSGLIWVKGPGGPARALWHVWHEGAACVIGDGPGEQPLPGLADGGPAEVTVRSKDKGGRLVSWAATVVELPPDTEAWTAAVAELKGKRLNAPDGEAMTGRWARECRLLRLEPTGATAPLPDGSLAEAPLPTPVTTRRPAPAGLPRLLFKRKRRRDRS